MKFYFDFSPLKRLVCGRFFGTGGSYKSPQAEQAYIHTVKRQY